MLVRPFAALRPRANTAQSVIAPPYDVVDTDEARALADGRPKSFLHISRPEIDLPDGADPYSDEVYAKGAENLNRLVSEGVLERESKPCYYVYRMTMGGHSQTGIAAAGSVSAYENDRIHRHELTRPDKENDRVRNIESLNAQTGPVLLTYKSDATVDGLLAAAAGSEPLLEAIGQHDVIHTIWRIDDDETIAALTSAIDALGDLYIADGHHRSAAASRVAEARRNDSGPGPGNSANAADDVNTGNASHEFFLTVAFPDNQMLVFDYNRVVADLNGLSNEEFLAAVGEVFEVTPSSEPAKPESARSFGMYLDGQWYRLTAEAAGADDNPVERLDVSVLQNRLIAPVLGIDNPRTDARIGFVGGVRGLEELERRVDTGKAAVAFALYPTGMRDLMDVADAGLLMPPKSTWFEPKLADGLLSHVLD